MRILVFVAILALLALGCGKKDKDKPDKKPGPTTDEPGTPDNPTDTPKPPDEPKPDEAEVATEEDFEEEAEKEVTADNLEKKVAEMEEEVGD